MFTWAAFFRFTVFSSKDKLELVYGRELEKCNSKVVINGISINQFIDQRMLFTLKLNSIRVSFLRMTTFTLSPGTCSADL